MSNGSNKWDVRFSRISWLDGVLKGHPNVTSVIRRDDIVFEIQRKKGPPITLLCLDEYAFGVAAAERAFQEFPDVNLIYVGGKWNKYTAEAKELCSERSIGLYNAGELAGALWKNDFRFYVKADSDDDPIRRERSA
jgi:hypothetical protein